ncbi:ABC transporter permease [Gordonia shandongensis]|uniref:ABC transporter permease n=1 Tax=Gordonia shandongensis TaxID=376351 RepID=UPI00047C0890|nr:iron ABC transporter permease [Gordonia shandongensis]
MRAAALVPAIFVAVLFVWPVAALVKRSLEPGTPGVRGGASVGELLRRTDAWQLLGVTVAQAAASAALTVVVAAPIVWLVATVDLPGTGVLRVLVTLPFVLPTVVVGVAFHALLTGPLAGLGIDDGWPAILLAHVFLNVAVVVRVVSAAWERVDPRTLEAARSLGAGRFRAFRDVVLPRILPATAAAAALVFMFCSTSFGVVLILGASRARTLETEIYYQGFGSFRIPEVVVLSALQIVVVVCALVLARAVSRGAGVSGAGSTPLRADGAHRRRPAGRIRIVVAVVIAWTVLWLLVPLLSLGVRSVRPDGGGWTTAGYRSLATPSGGMSALDSLVYSVTSALAAMVVALVIGLLLALSVTRGGGRTARVAAVFAALPLGVSAVTLGFGYLLVVSALPAEVTGSPLVIPAVQALIAIPVVAGVMIPALGQVPPRLRDAAAALGAGPLRVIVSVDLRMTARTLCAAAGFAFVMAIGEFGATTFLARPDTTTLPVLIGTLMGRPGTDELATAMAASTVLVLVGAVVIAVIELIAVTGTRPRSSTRQAPAC